MAIDRFPVEAGHVLQFARAIGDPSPVYVDPEAARAAGLEAIPAPPTFAMASAHFDPEYPLRPNPGRPWIGSADTATGYGPDDVDELASMLYAEQHFEYHRPLMVGDVLTGAERAGDTWTKQGRRGGELRFTEVITDFVDQSGAPVVTSRTVSVSTARPPVTPQEPQEPQEPRS
ncbi:FAS1-like dehydratase domain-containing protein [Nocardioides acrostichi]|uniref:MaoC family dehydratase N-terminal domain-containing protein n=1 Tax=Nocardioides acrostichi TaxID=2784339 RepID=A0A930UZ19_9ACTN|nr:MaoC family dehydratase N-terminal domain-containing protein [Nocardioides acrostichi]MBF4162716.1 MaoC family dehydratase N-terminal domain-containing protein [Nocardioides acrostichi]